MRSRISIGSLKNLNWPVLFQKSALEVKTRTKPSSHLPLVSSGLFLGNSVAAQFQHSMHETFFHELVLKHTALPPLESPQAEISMTSIVGEMRRSVCSCVREWQKLSLPKYHLHLSWVRHANFVRASRCVCLRIAHVDISRLVGRGGRGQRGLVGVEERS
jgi:hypothetical protein